MDSDSWTPLHYSTFYNHFKVFEKLIYHSETNVNVVNKTGATALHFAALNGHVYLVELMLNKPSLDTVSI